MDSIIGAEYEGGEDEKRYRRFINTAIADKRVTKYKKYKVTLEPTSKHDPYKCEIAEAEALKKDLGLGEELNNENSLAALIKKKNQINFEDMVSKLEEKATAINGRKRKTKTSMPSDADF